MISRTTEMIHDLFWLVREDECRPVRFFLMIGQESFNVLFTEAFFPYTMSAGPEPVPEPSGRHRGFTRGAKYRLDLQGPGRKAIANRRGVALVSASVPFGPFPEGFLFRGDCDQ